MSWRRAPGDDLAARAEALRRLAALVRSGAPPRTALRQWTDDCPAALQGPTRRVGARLALGHSLERAMDPLEDGFGCDAVMLRVLIKVAAELGIDLARLLEGHARTVERRRAAQLQAQAAVAGARLSGRMVSALPLLCLPLLPAARAPLFDPLGLVLMLLGMALVVLGMRWIDRLVPRPDATEDPAAALAELAAAALGAGAALKTALDALAAEGFGSLTEPLGRARRLVRLGLSWPQALRRGGHPVLADLGAVLHRAEVLGQPAARSLDVWARQRRADAG
ncbi:MAG: type II secretion system F family protein, partial [Actinomycetota bacterium]